MSSNIFGDFLSEKLIEKCITLRELSRRTGIDASNLSKLERGIFSPPKKRETLESIAAGLELSSAEATELYDRADTAGGQFPGELSHIKENPAIPLLLRAVDNKQLTEEKIHELVALIEEENTYQGDFPD